MGYPEHPHQRRTNVSGMFLVAAVLAGLSLVGLGLLALLGVSFFRVSRSVAMPPPAPMVVSEYPIPTESISASVENVVVEIGQNGETLFNGEAMTLEQIEARLQQLAQQAPLLSGRAAIYVVEGTPFEHVQDVQAMFQRLGVEDPNLSTIPPAREVNIELDAKGKAAIDGNPADDPQGALQEIVQKHGSRATVILRADPKCPAEAVVRLKDLCQQLGFGKVTIDDDAAEATP
jgi:biopolymer transport protein ExbD